MCNRDIYITNIPDGDGTCNIRQILEDHLSVYLAHIGQIDWLKIVDVQKRDRDVKTRVGFLKMTDRACYQAVIEAIDGKSYTLQNDERVLHAALSKSLTFEYEPNGVSLPATTTITTATAPATIATVATATDSDSTTENEMKELRESVRQLKLNIETTYMECSILASELYTAQEESAALKTKCDAFKRSSEQSVATQVQTCSICCSQYSDVYCDYSGRRRSQTFICVHRCSEMFKNVQKRSRLIGI